MEHFFRSLESNILLFGKVIKLSFLFIIYTLIYLVREMEKYRNSEIK